MQIYQMPPLRRQHSRFKVGSNCKMFTEGNLDFSAYCRDISSGGAGIVTDVELPKNSLVRLLLNIPWKEDKVEAFGRVAWCNKLTDRYYRLGVKFSLPV
ncbi:hypothetical protein DRQ26_05730 [bacterium]|nr:MAG: hypothetical protein DRQ26_05730 [bacterium]